jgi:hypothetical protein
LGALVGIIVTWLAFYAREQYDLSFEDKNYWAVCRLVNMSIIAEAVTSYVQTNSAPGPITLEALVNAKVLPEWSEIYICPAQFGFVPHRTNYDVSYRSKLFEPSQIAANYSNGSYYIETLPDEYRVRCRYHTNELYVEIPRPNSTNEP